MVGRMTVDEIARLLFARLSAQVVTDLRGEDPVLALEVHFAPLQVRPLAATEAPGTETCSTDGYYEADLDPARPWIVYADDVAPQRARFTLVHELGHHLLQTDACDLLDPIDQVGSDAQAAEEQVCHALAGLVLVPDHLVPDGPLTPESIVAAHEASGASWEATAVRLIRSSTEPAAVVLVREAGTVAFGAASPSLGSGWWARGAELDRHGPLWNAPTRSIRSQPDTYRFGLPGARRMFVDSVPVDGHLAVAVMTMTPSDGHFEVLTDPAPAWREDAKMCLFCPAERGTGWCELCSGRRCDECGRCGCDGAPLEHPHCDVCGRREAHRPGAPMCRSCEKDFE